MFKENCPRWRHNKLIDWLITYIQICLPIIVKNNPRFFAVSRRWIIALRWVLDNEKVNNRRYAECIVYKMYVREIYTTCTLYLCLVDIWLLGTVKETPEWHELSERFERLWQRQHSRQLPEFSIIDYEMCQIKLIAVVGLVLVEM